MKYAVEVSNLKKSYGKFQALKGISFKVRKGEIFGLLGPNGAGKTTAINILGGLLTKDSGTIRILNKNPDEVRNRINIATAYSWMSGILKVHENLRIFAKIYNVQKPEERINYLIDTFGLSDLRNSKSYSLSSGEGTRLNICKGLINNPEVLLLDEATVGLDPEIANKTRNIIRNIQKKEKTSILFTSHIMHEVEHLCNRIAFLSHGKILKIGTAESMKKLIDKQIVRIDYIAGKTPIKSILNKMDVDILYIKKNRVSIGIRQKKFKLHELLHPILKAGIKIKDMHVRKPNLDDVFIKIAKEEK